MSNHYYNQNDSLLESKPKYINYIISGFTLKFKTDNGVFSKDRVDFGTTVLLENIKFNGEHNTIVDIGCGYGVVGIALAKQYPDSQIVMIDINDRAVNLSKENLNINRVTNAVVHESYLFENVNINTCDAIISNPPIRAGKKVVFSIIEESYNRLRDGGELWFVIQKKQGAASSEKRMKELYKKVEIVSIKKGYIILKATK